ncbi:hypothetical protein S40285_06610 [Stachybotrys chlorohalonatus IBT 40285]|uniref:NAD-dependent epimerase/dehydratase domain-containing protein n=1 Tax=Stachybotrys chlorohalonatus (strain IBT 40285) TaxID=1283841 RepID=A0A084R1Q9_STAC4|nr:hypothetical protein S40285_06610 [Stachybotrys chlorohalonata IBT 40285]
MPSGLVLLTGATGYIGSHTGLVALKNGYRLRLIIRRAEQSNKLKALFKDHVNQLEFVVVPDFTKPNAFDDAIVDVDYVVHVASPMVGKGVDFKKDYVEPAVHGTLSILNAAKSTSSVRKVSIVSSILALLPPDTFVPDVKLPAVVRENSGIKFDIDVNTPVPESPASHGIKYQGSKILAHQATRDWLEAEKPSFAVLTFHPVYVIGPSLIQTSAENIDTVNGVFWNVIRTGEVMLKPTTYVDVRDVAEALVKSLGVSVPSGQEFILHSVPTTWSDIAEAVHTLYPHQDFKLKKIPDDKLDIELENKAAKEMLGIPGRPIEELVRGVVDQQLSFNS